jgi:hypothetical protein
MEIKVETKDGPEEIRKAIKVLQSFLEGQPARNEDIEAKQAAMGIFKEEKPKKTEKNEEAFSDVQIIPY